MCQSFYGGRCERCHEVVNTALRGDSTPCPNCGAEVSLLKLEGRLDQCGKCLLIKPIIGVHPFHYRFGPICQNCWECLDRPKMVCANCGEQKTRTRMISKYCEACRITFASSRGECPECLQVKLLNCKDLSGRKICSTCADRLSDPVGACAVCHKVKRLNNKHPYKQDSRVCSNCYKLLTTPWGSCGRCPRMTYLPYLWEGERICGPCHRGLKRSGSVHKRRNALFQYPHFGICAECEEEKKLERNHPNKEGGICSGCRKRSQRTNGTCNRCGMPRQLVAKDPAAPEQLICEGCRLELKGKPPAKRRNIHC